MVQTHDFKRNRWLDINIATYRQPATADVIPPPVDAVAPAGWQYAVDGRPWLCLEVDTVHAVNAQDRRGTFAIPEGLRGWIEYAHRADVWYFRLRGTAELGCFELIQWDNHAPGVLTACAFSAMRIEPWYPIQPCPIGAGDVLELTNRGRGSMKIGYPNRYQGRAPGRNARARSTRRTSGVAPRVDAGDRYRRRLLARGSTPKRTGDLRRSERTIVDTDAQGRITTKYHVTQPGADYYVEVADQVSAP